MAGVLSTTRKLPCFRSSFPLNKVTKSHGILNVLGAVRYKSFSFSDPNPGEDYQHIVKSSVPTYHFQDSLPRLPIPELNKTCERYLKAQQPLLDPTSFNQTKSYVEDFLKNDGVKCQNSLKTENGKKKNTSYISEPWFNMYLSDRKPLPINYNPFLVFVNNEKPQYNTQLVKASNLVISSLRFYRSLNEEVLEPEVYHLNPSKSDTPLFRKITGMLPRSMSWYGAYLFKAFPLDMSQYTNLFNTTRVPEIGKDRIKHVHGKKHILVMKGGHFYVFDVIDKDGNIVGPDVVISNIEQILNTKEPVAKQPLGLLTTENRDIWAEARQHLESLGNSEQLDLIDSSLFNLVLDDAIPGADPVRLVRVFLHSDGVNRWFDKSFSLIVTRDGTAGINFEHSWGDGVAILRYFNDIHKDSTVKPRVHPNTLRCTSTVRKLDFNVDDKMKSMIEEAKSKYDKICSSLEVRVLDYQKFGRQLCKPLNISPDALMQLAFQVANDQLTGKQVATYESCSTAAFKHGRTETVRPCTLETQKFCRALRLAKPLHRTELQHMIVECSKIHSNLIKEAAMGQGFDRHLFALWLQAEAMGLKPALFSDPAYAKINHNILSTSTLSSDNLQLGAFGPVVQDGFGIGYSLWKNRLGCIVTNYKGHSNGSGFVDALQHTFDKIQQILCP